MFDDFLRFAPVLVTILGWWLVNRQNNMRECRKEHRTLIDVTKGKIVAIADDARSYFADTTSSAAPCIKWALQLLEIELERLSEDGVLSDGLMAALVTFTEACTAGDFESADRQAHDEGSKRIEQIILSRNGLINALEAWFSSTYLARKRNWWSLRPAR